MRVPLPEIPIPRPLGHKMYRRPRQTPNIKNEEFEAEGYHDYSIHRLYDYYKTAQFVLKLDTPAERIDFVNPFERAWERTEKKWHRLNHAPLHAPRRAWCLSPIPRYYDIEDYYSHITRTIQPLDSAGKPLAGEERQKLWQQCYSSLNLPYENFEKRITELLICTLGDKTEFDKDSANKFLANFIDGGHTALGHTRLLFDQRLSLNPRCESFWIRSGFEELYKVEDLVTGEIKTDRHFIPRLIGDHRHKLGEFAFTMRDELKLNLEDSQFDSFYQKDKKFEGCLAPWIYVLERDSDHLWQCPGFEPDSGEEYCYGQVAVKNTHELKDRIQHWGIHDEQEIYDTRLECLRATAISSLFNWLNAQAHCAGWTQYTDDGSINLTSQLVLSDGREFFFAVGQLRDIAFNINWDLMKASNPSYSHLFIERQPNRVIFEGPYNLFDEYDPASGTFKHKDEKTSELKQGLNPRVMQYFLNCLVMK
ncbi:28S ribosomal protein S30, mitochondrial [Aphelenchoides bicaudatus]|nr:28S ribosomal protein S30, mitochondrial [Aphelenchoides bicaudatus]